MEHDSVAGRFIGLVTSMICKRKRENCWSRDCDDLYSKQHGLPADLFSSLALIDFHQLKWRTWQPQEGTFVAIQDQARENG